MPFSIAVRIGGNARGASKSSASSKDAVAERRAAFFRDPVADWKPPAKALAAE